MPTYNTPPELLQRAIDSVLNQHADVRLVVVNDGGTPPTVPKGVTVHHLPENRGRYFCDAVVLAAVDEGWFATHDSDDWSEPDAYSDLVAAAGNHSAAIAPYWRHRRDGRVLRNRTRPTAPSPTWRYVGHACASLATVDRWRQAGGVHPGYRLGFDTLHMLLLTVTGPLPAAATPRYHWCQRPDSLTGHPATNHASQARLKARSNLRKLWAKCWAGRRNVAAVIAADTPPHLAEAVAEEADKLRAVL